MKKILVAVAMLLVATMALSVSAFGATPAYQFGAEYGQQVYYIGDATTAAPVIDGTIGSGEYTKTVTLTDPAYFVNANTVKVDTPEFAGTSAPQEFKLHFSYDADYIYIAMEDDCWFVDELDFSVRSNYQIKLGGNLNNAAEYMQWGIRGFDDKVGAGATCKPSGGTLHASGANVLEEEEMLVESIVVSTGGKFVNEEDGTETIVPVKQVVEMKIDKAKFLALTNEYCKYDENGDEMSYSELPNAFFFYFRIQSYDITGATPAPHQSYSLWSCAELTPDQMTATGSTVDIIPFLYVMGAEGTEVKVPTAAAVETDPVETDPVETDPVETDPVAPVETDPVAPVDTDPVDPADTDPVDDGGCGASVTAMGLALVATLGTCAVFATKKKED